jgi:uncharacterized protein YkwD
MSAAARFRYTMVAAATTVVIGVGFTAVGLTRHANAVGLTRHANAGTAGYAGGAAAQPPDPTAPGGDPADRLAGATAATTAPARTASARTASARPSATPSVRASSAAPKPRATRTAAGPGPRKAAPARPAPKAPPVTSGSILDQVLAHINDARTRNGLAPYRLDGDLSKASALHNQLMIDGCGLSHQCPGEGGIGDRFSARGVRWSSAGENIGLGSAGSGDAEIVKAANGLTDSMLAEVAPNDGHRKNLLSTGFKRIGLSVVRDGKGVVWMTQDFVN